MLAVSDEAERLLSALENSLVAYAYFDASDRLVLWNRAYIRLNIRIRPLIRKGALFSDLLAELILRGQIEIPEAQREAWIAERLRLRRHGETAFRKLADGRTYLAQERKDELGGTLGFWLDVTDMFQHGAASSSEDMPLTVPCSLHEPGLQDRIRTRLQTVMLVLDYLKTSCERDSDAHAIVDAITAAKDISICLDKARP